MASVDQTRPHCVNQMGKTHSKPLAVWHGRGMARYVWIGHNTVYHCTHDWQTLQFTEMQPDLTILHQSYKYSCYQSWSTGSWFHILDSRNIIPGSLTNIRDFVEIILLYTGLCFTDISFLLQDTRKDGSKHSIQDISILSCASEDSIFVEQVPEYVRKMRPFVQSTVNWKIQQIYKLPEISVHLKSCEIRLLDLPSLSRRKSSKTAPYT